MRILAVADESARKYYDFYRPGILDEFDLIIGCGDLSREYLEFLVTLAHCPLIYIHGNHDEAFVENPPEGCICIEDTIFEYQGIRFLGLGGSYRYKKEGTYLYTEGQMKFRILKLLPKLVFKKGFDVLVSHAPPYSFGDQEHLPHRGFHCFEDLLIEYRPSIMLHGHIHLNYGYKIPQQYQYQNTTIYNAYEYCIIEIKNNKGE